MTSQSLEKKVTIIVPNESIPVNDILVWLRNYGDPLTMPKKVMDEFGIWGGAWELTIRLHRVGNVVKHIPTSAFIGRDRVTAFYQGQVKVCHKCGGRDHFSITCNVMKCSRCQGTGHLAKECDKVRCNLCFKLGHVKARCPEAWANMGERVWKEFETGMSEQTPGETSGGRRDEAIQEVVDSPPGSQQPVRQAESHPLPQRETRASTKASGSGQMKVKVVVERVDEGKGAGEGVVSSPPEAAGETPSSVVVDPVQDVNGVDESAQEEEFKEVKGKKNKKKEKAGSVAPSKQAGRNTRSNSVPEVSKVAQKGKAGKSGGSKMARGNSFQVLANMGDGSADGEVLDPATGDSLVSGSGTKKP